MQTERKPKHLKGNGDEREVRRYSPICDIFNQQLSALKLSARQIAKDKSYSIPPIVQKFIDEFEGKAA